MHETNLTSYFPMCYLSLNGLFIKKFLPRLRENGGNAMDSSKTVLEKALQLKPQERIVVVEGLLMSLDEPDKEIDEIWAVEAEKRLAAYRGGKLKGIPYEEVFGEKI